MKNNNKMNKQRTTLELTIKCWKLIQQYNPWYLFFSGIIVVIEGGIPSVLLFVLQKIINMLQQQQNSLGVVISWGAIYATLNLLSMCISQVYVLYATKFSLKFDKYIKNEILNKASKLQLENFENPETYNIINRAQAQNGASILNYIKSIFNAIKAIVTVSSVLLILMQFPGWWIALVFVVPLIKCICTIRLNKKWYAVRTKRTATERQSWYIEFLMTTGNAFKEIKMFGLGDYLIGKYKVFKEMIIKEEMQMINKQFLLQIMAEVINGIANGAVFIYIIYEGFKKVILIGDVTAYIEGVNSIKSSIETIFNIIGEINHQVLYISWIFQFFDLEIEVTQGDVFIDEIKEIQFKDVSFRYHHEGDYVLKNINLELRKGKVVALVGENGSGKTTLIKLLLGFYDNYEGEILVNGIELNKINKTVYLKKISGVFQDYIKYEASVRENISFGNIIDLKCDKKIWSVLHEMKLDDVLSNDQGLDIMLGNWFGKKQLSVGEWQRIAIARSIFRKADVYILDEPDASLDVIKQAELIPIYKNASGSGITVFISHKVNYIHTFCDELVVLKKGKVVEKGTHNDLLNLKGQYYKMFKNSELLEGEKVFLA